LGMECLLLHVEPPGRTPASIAHARERGRLAALAEANDFSAGVHTEVIGGDPDTGLVAAAESGDVELLVVGTSGPAPAAPER
ncbi:universal stress protein, partial [Bacillus cereus]